VKRFLLSLVVATVAAVTAATVATPAAYACGNGGGYSYAGLASSQRAYGVGAFVTPLDAFDVLAGHVAGWVGVGGPGLGPNGTDEWLQVGFSGFPGLDGSDLYYELALPNRMPTYHQIGSGLPFGKPAHISVLEIHKRPNWWRVWLNGRHASKPIYLPGSHGRWSPIATAESWDGGGGGACNGFLYRFRRVSIARFPGGGWKELNSGYRITSSSTRVQLAWNRGAFLAAQGAVAVRTLASLQP
jgi:hypothetical protein